MKIYGKFPYIYLYKRTIWTTCNVYHPKKGNTLLSSQYSSLYPSAIQKFVINDAAILGKENVSLAHHPMPKRVNQFSSFYLAYL